MVSSSIVSNALSNSSGKKCPSHKSSDRKRQGLSGADADSPCLSHVSILELITLATRDAML